MNPVGSRLLFILNIQSVTFVFIFMVLVLHHPIENQQISEIKSEFY
ncbi:MAG: hypothetical protein CLLPBCKN_007643 [Chroococcidiopsis cubana SAG 39.79]|nr:hypothetical protein [Chroococcidiopsis cubana SAG 39.79]